MEKKRTHFNTYLLPHTHAHTFTRTRTCMRARTHTRTHTYSMWPGGRWWCSQRVCSGGAFRDQWSIGTTHLPYCPPFIQACNLSALSHQGCRSAFCDNVTMPQFTVKSGMSLQQCGMIRVIERHFNGVCNNNQLFNTNLTGSVFSLTFTQWSVTRWQVLSVQHSNANKQKDRTVNRFQTGVPILGMSLWSKSKEIECWKCK